MARKPKPVHPQLEELQSAAAAENVAVREAATAVQHAEAELEGLSTLVVAAYVDGDEARASKHRATVTGAEDKLADLRLRLEAQTQRASAASAAAAAFRAANAEQLITELKPQGEIITVALRDALTQVVALDARWTDHAHRVNRLVAAAPGASPLLDGAPADHPLTAIVRQLRRALGNGAQIPAPEPRWAGRRQRADDDRTHRLVRAQRIGNQTQVERLQRPG